MQTLPFFLEATTKTSRKTVQKKVAPLAYEIGGNSGAGNYGMFLSLVFYECDPMPVSRF